MTGIEDELKARLNQRLKNSPHHYHYVKVLLLYWEGTSEEAVAFRQEGRDLGEYLTKELKYRVQEFVIPKKLPQPSLQARILDEVVHASNSGHSGDGKALLIIHYGGHGDEDGDAEGRAVWSADAMSSDNEPLVYWGRIQDSIAEHCTADVLLLLDCCFSAQAARAHGSIQGRIEMLTAASKRELTVGPGPRSFTVAFMAALKSALATGESSSVSSIHATLIHRSAGLFATAVNIAIRSGYPDRSIRLVPLGQVSKATVEFEDASPSSSSIRLVIHGVELDGEQVDRFIAWLRCDMPPNVSIVVEDVVRRTASLQSLVLDAASDPGRPLASGLYRQTLVSLNAASADISTLLGRYEDGRSKLAKQGASAESQDLALQGQAVELLHQLQQKNSGMTDTVEMGLLYGPMACNAADMGQVIQDPLLKDLGFISNHLRMRQMISQADNESHASHTDSDAQPRSLEVLQDCIMSPTTTGSMYEEYKNYGPYVDPARLTEVQARIALTAELLGASKSPAFRALQCSGWHHSPEKRQFVLRFAIPEGASPIQDPKRIPTLKSIMRKTTGPDRPTLGQRLRLALIIAKAVRHWHSVGWVHQNINSHNILFFPRTSGKVDYGEPFLQGFDFARPHLDPSFGNYVEDVSFDVYRHPSRQGLARRGHQKVHDIYSLGVVLLEIGLWEDACVTGGWRKGKDIAVTDMCANLKRNALNRLAHYAGKAYQEAVSICLESNFGVDMDDAAGSRLAAAFETLVLGRLRKGQDLS